MVTWRRWTERVLLVTAGIPVFIPGGPGLRAVAGDDRNLAAVLAGSWGAAVEVTLKLGEDFELVLDRHGKPTSLDLTEAGLAKLAVFGGKPVPVVLVAGEDGTTITVKPQEPGPVVRRITEG